MYNYMQCGYYSYYEEGTFISNMTLLEARFAMEKVFLGWGFFDRKRKSTLYCSLNGENSHRSTTFLFSTFQTFLDVLR